MDLLSSSRGSAEKRSRRGGERGSSQIGMAATAVGAAEAGDLPPPGGSHAGDLPEELHMGSLWSSLVGDIEAPAPPDNPFLEDDMDEDGYLLRCFNVTTGCCAGGYGAVQGQWSHLGEYLRDRRCAPSDSKATGGHLYSAEDTVAEGNSEPQKPRRWSSKKQELRL